MKQERESSQKQPDAESIPADSISAIPETETTESGADSEMHEHEPEVSKPETVEPEAEPKPESVPAALPISSAPVGGRGKKAILIPAAPTTPAAEVAGSRY